MAIEDILRALDEQADTEIEDIRRIASLQAENLRRDARAEAGRIVSSAVDAAVQAASAKAGKRLNSARLQARRRIAGVREEVAENAVRQAAEKLAAFRAAPEYEAVFGRLLGEAAESAPVRSAEPGWELLVDPADEALAERLSGELRLPCTIVPDLHTTGGFDIALFAQRVMLVNTFESRLEKARELTGARIAQILMAP